MSTIKIVKVKKEIPVMLDGEMIFGMLDDGRRTASFNCLETVEMEPFGGKCDVQVMRDGNVYVTERPKRVKNKAIFRDDNCTLSHGQNGRYYFVFTLCDELLDELPQRLVTQASVIARKVMRATDICAGTKNREQR
ncbi:MAG: hypothetical protein K6D37_00400 [Prevotella sp.]|nr:hypothetical protein [Prevotella sp.]